MAQQDCTKQSFVMYVSFLDAAMGLEDDEFREYVLRLKDYALYGIEGNSESPLINGLMAMAMPLMDAAEKRRRVKASNGEKGAEYGILGGRPRKGETADEYRRRKALETLKEQQETPNITPKKGLNVNGNVNENDKDNGNANVKENVNAKAEDNFMESLEIGSDDYECHNVFDISSLQGYQEYIDSTSRGLDYQGPQQSSLSSTKAPSIDSKSFKESCESRGTGRDGGVLAALRAKDNDYGEDIGEAVYRDLMRDIKLLNDIDDGKRPQSEYKEVFGRAVDTYYAYTGYADYNEAKVFINSKKAALRR